MSNAQAQRQIETGKWVLVNETIVDLPTHYAVQQYRHQNVQPDRAQGLLWTVTLSREGRVLNVR